jgi:hypothetical protein
MIKTIIFISAGVLIALSSCNHVVKKGNGHVTTEQRTVSPFTKIAIEGTFPVEISQNGSDEAVKVEADENLQKLIAVNTEGGKLSVKLADDAAINPSTKMKVYINIKNLTDLDFKSVGTLTTTDTLKLDSLNINSEAVGKLIFDVNAKYLHANFESVGNTVLAGNVYEARINNKSIGTLSASDLKTKIMMIHNASVGLTEVYADSAFYIRSTSVGALYYRGPGDVKELKSEGIGRVQKKE